MVGVQDDVEASGGERANDLNVRVCRSFAEKIDGHRFFLALGGSIGSVGGVLKDFPMDFCGGFGEILNSFEDLLNKMTKNSRK